MNSRSLPPPLKTDSLTRASQSNDDRCGGSHGSGVLACSVFRFSPKGALRELNPGAQPKLEGAYALRQRLSPGNAVHAAPRLS